MVLGSRGARSLTTLKAYGQEGIHASHSAQRSNTTRRVAPRVTHSPWSRARCTSALLSPALPCLVGGRSPLPPPPRLQGRQVRCRLLVCVLGECPAWRWRQRFRPPGVFGGSALCLILGSRGSRPLRSQKSASHMCQRLNTCHPEIIDPLRHLNVQSCRHQYGALLPLSAVQGRRGGRFEIRPPTT